MGMTSCSIKRLNFEMLFGFRSVVTLRTNMRLSLFLTKEVIQGTGFGVEGLKLYWIDYQTALADFLFEAAPSARSLICEHWKARSILSAGPYLTIKHPFSFHLLLQ